MVGIDERRFWFLEIYKHVETHIEGEVIAESWDWEGKIESFSAIQKTRFLDDFVPQLFLFYFYEWGENWMYRDEGFSWVPSERKLKELRRIQICTSQKIRIFLTQWKWTIKFHSTQTWVKTFNKCSMISNIIQAVKNLNHRSGTSSFSGEFQIFDHFSSHRNRNSCMKFNNSFRVELLAPNGDFPSSPIIWK